MSCRRGLGIETIANHKRKGKVDEKYKKQTDSIHNGSSGLVLCLVKHRRAGGHQTYATLDRTDLSADDNLELKFSLQHWRVYLKNYYTGRLIGSDTAPEGWLAGNTALAGAFADLGVVLQGDPNVSDRLVEQFDLQEFYDPGRATDGPGKTADIKPACGGERGIRPVPLTI